MLYTDKYLHMDDFLLSKYNVIGPAYVHGIMQEEAWLEDTNNSQEFIFISHLRFDLLREDFTTGKD